MTSGSFVLCTADEFRKMAGEASDRKLIVYTIAPGIFGLAIQPAPGACEFQLRDEFMESSARAFRNLSECVELLLTLCDDRPLLLDIHRVVPSQQS